MTTNQENAVYDRHQLGPFPGHCLRLTRSIPSVVSDSLILIDVALCVTVQGRNRLMNKAIVCCVLPVLPSACLFLFSSAPVGGPFSAFLRTTTARRTYRVHPSLASSHPRILRPPHHTRVVGRPLLIGRPTRQRRQQGLFGPFPETAHFVSPPFLGDGLQPHCLYSHVIVDLAGDRCRPARL